MSEINLALLADFIEEAGEHLDEIESLLLRLGDNPEDLEVLNDIFRPVHNIKGGAQITGLDRVSRLSHRLEDLLDVLRQGKKPSDAGIVDLLIATRDRIVQLLGELEQTQTEISEIDDLVDDLTVAMSLDAPAAEVSDAAGEPDWVQEMEAGIDAPATSMASTSGGDNSYDEEHDQELFGIFVSHLQEQIHTLRQAVVQESHQDDMAHHLDWCADVVDGLWSSANYMGYQELVELYGDWLNDIETAHQQVLTGAEVSQEFMLAYLDRITAMFPELAEGVPAASAPAPAAETPAVSAQDAAPASPTPTDPVDDITASVMGMFGEGGDAAPAETAAPEPVAEPSAGAAEAEDSSISGSGLEINMGLLPDFITEAGEHLEEVEALLLQLADDPHNVELMNDVFRPVHNIKGGSQITGLARVSRLSHRLEDLLDLLRQEKISSSTSIVDLLIDTRDRIAHLVLELAEHQEEMSGIDDLVLKISELIELETGVKQEYVITGGAEQAESAGLDSGSHYQEEHDQELFSIFMAHLREQTSILRKSIKEMKKEPDKEQHLSWCQDIISRLWSAANYMGYDELTELYDTWETETEAAISEVRAGRTPELEFMEAHLAQLDNMFPQLPHVPTTSIKGELDEPPAAAPPAAAQAAQVAAPTGDESSLYQRLADAMDKAEGPSAASQQETLNQVYEQVTQTAQTGDEAPKQAPGRQTQAARADAGAGAEAGAADKAKARADINEKKVRKSMRVDAEKIDSLMNLVGELVVDRSYFFQLSNEMRQIQNYYKDMPFMDQKDIKTLRAFTYRLGEAIASLGRTSNELQEGVMKMRMLPISQIFNRYPRLVRDLTHNTDKKVELVIRGEETELDKMIVEELSDPLIHIIRNAVDHGLETRQERLAASKPEVGTLELNAYQESNNIVIEVTDNGRGINPQKIRDKAIEKRLYSEEELDKMAPGDLTQLILAPGFSTAEKITGTSGRGVGMDVVKRNIEKLNGTLEIESIPGQRTQMRLKIPLTLAIIHALMIRVGQDLFTIPLANVDETVRIFKDSTSQVEGVEVIHLRGQALPIFHLSNLFNIRADEASEKAFVVIVNTEGRRTGFVVDELIGQEEVVIKPLADYVQEKSGFSGATIVGDGRISLILDAYEMVKMTSGRQADKHRRQAQQLRTRMRRGPRRKPAMEPQAPGPDGGSVH